MVRTALFNWAQARHSGGTFVFRIEDTDAARDSEESYQAIIDSLEWLGLNWDEGVNVGGPHEPYRQSQRSEIYTDVLNKLIEAGEVYPAYSTNEEVQERHKAAGRDPHAGDLYVFRGKRGDLVKILWHDGLGMSLYAKRLERGRFLWPAPAGGAVSISSAQLAYMLDGIDWRNPQHTYRPQVAG